MASLHQKYKDEIVPILKERLGESNVMALPKLTKIVINMGVGQAVNDKKLLIIYSLSNTHVCLLYTSPSPRDGLLSRMPSSA